MTDQPAGEQRTGTRSVEALDALAREFFGGAYGTVGSEGNELLRQTAGKALAAAMPALRRQIAEEIADVLDAANTGSDCLKVTPPLDRGFHAGLARGAELVREYGGKA